MEELLNLESGSDELGIYFTETQHEDEGLRMVYDKLKGLPERYLKAIEGLIDILIQEQHGRENYKKLSGLNEETRSLVVELIEYSISGTHRTVIRAKKQI